VRALVVTSVHRADDPRIRERTVRSLAGAFEVRYATRAPAPSSGGDHEWVELKGGRVRRWWGALRQMCRGDLAVVSMHDPELIGIMMPLRENPKMKGADTNDGSFWIRMKTLGSSPVAQMDRAQVS